MQKVQPEWRGHAREEPWRWRADADRSGLWPRSREFRVAVVTQCIYSAPPGGNLASFQF